MVNMLVIPDEIRNNFPDDHLFFNLMAISGKVFRDVRGRKTMQIVIEGKSYFIKQHFGVGWREIVKNYLSLKKPILGAMTEVGAIEKLTQLGISTTPLVGYGVQGCNPASQKSFIITEDLGDIVSLEDICADWKSNPPEAAFKSRLMIALAELAAKLHSAGLSHRDFYLCHFVLKKTELAKGKLDLILIDLHRVLLNQSPHGNSVMKDISALVFSTMDFGFTTEDWALFKRHYLPQSEDFWADVSIRANKLYAKFHSDKFQKKLTVERLGVD